MNAIKKQISRNRIKLIISVAGEDVMRYFDEELSRLSPEVSIPGFRPGKAPRVMLIETIGHSRIAHLALEQAINQAFQEGVSQHKQTPVSQPAISISKHPAFSEDQKNNELVFEVEYDVVPDVKVGNYKKIKIAKQKEDFSVSDKEVDGVIKYLQRQKSVLTDKDGESVNGDWLEISFKGSVKHVVIEKLTSTNMPIVLGETNFIPGFGEKLSGIKKGESRTFEIKLPKDFPDKELAGKSASFTVECLAVKKIDLPKIDKEFVASFGLNTEAELRSRVKESLVQEKQVASFQTKKSLIAQELIKITKVDIPQSLIAGEAQRMRSALENDLKNRGMTIEKYQESLKIDDKKMLSDLEAQSKRNITLGLALAEVARSEGVSIAKEENVDELYAKLIEMLKI